MKKIDLKKMILPCLALVVFISGTIYYCISGTTQASVIYFGLLLISLGILVVYYFINRKE